LGFTVPFKVAELRVTDVANPVETTGVLITAGGEDIGVKEAAIIWLAVTEEKV
jgi:hypothetical protein